MKARYQKTLLTLAALAALTAARAGEETAVAPAPSVNPFSVVNVSLIEGVQSEYVFRGENLTPNAGSFFTSNLEGTAPGFASGQTFTLGAWTGIQSGEGNFPGFPTTVNGTAAHGPALSHDVDTGQNIPEKVSTHQTAYRELDLYLRYKLNLGSVVVVEAGNVAYLSTYETARTLELPKGHYFLSTRTRFTTQFRSGEGADYDRDQLYLSLGTNPKWFAYVVPKLTYYQSVYENGSAPYGGYLEGRVDGYMPVLKKNGGGDLFCLRPYLLLSFSFDDQSKPTSEYGRKYFNGWNDFEAGLEAPITVCKYFTVSGFVDYSHRITTPNLGTDRDEVLGGGRATLSF